MPSCDVRAERFLQEMWERLAKFGLEVHPDRTRLIEFGRFAAAGRAERGAGKPETFDFLGFTHCCGKTRQGAFAIKRVSVAKRMRAKLQTIKEQLKHAMHHQVAEVGQWLAPWCRAGSITTPCPATVTVSTSSALKWLGSGGTPCGVAVKSPDAGDGIG